MTFSATHKKWFIGAVLLALVLWVGWTRHTSPNPIYAKVLARKGKECAEKGQYAQAEDYLRQAIDKGPGSAIPHLYLGNLYAKQGMTEKALQSFLKASELSPDSHEVLYELGLAYFDLGKIDQAIRYWDQAVHAPENFIALPKYRYQLGLALAEKGDVAAASAEAENLRTLGQPQMASDLDAAISQGKSR